MPAGLPFHTLLPWGREPTSRAFLRHAGIERLYSGVSSRTASAPAISPLKRVQAAGGLSSRSWLYIARSPISISRQASSFGAASIRACATFRVNEALRRLPTRTATLNGAVMNSSGYVRIERAADPQGSDRKDQAGRGAVRQQLAGAVDQPAFRRGDARTDVNHLTFSADLARLVGHGAHVVHLDLERGEAGARLQGRVDAAAHHRIEKCRGDAAVYAAQRIIVIEHRLVVEGHVAELDFGHPEAQRSGDRWGGETPLHDAGHEGKAVDAAGLIDRRYAKARGGSRHHRGLRCHLRAYTRFR